MLQAAARTVGSDFEIGGVRARDSDAGDIQRTGGVDVVGD